MKTMILTGSLVLASAFFAFGIPLPEHPRPDWERAEWMNLNGEWDFGFAKDRLDRKILVPFGWGSPASGVKDGGDTGYYRRTVTVPAAWKGRRIFVIVGASDHDTTCTFDDVELGTHTGGYTPFEFELTDFVEFGKPQTLAFKVWDPSPAQAREGHYLYGKQGYGNARGIWQTVYLEARGDTYLDWVRLSPCLATGEVGVRARLAAPANRDMTLEMTIDCRTEKFPVKRGEMLVSQRVKLAKPHLWTLDDPYLYNVSFTLLPKSNNPTIRQSNNFPDTVKSYFGFREIGRGKTANGDPCVTLNGKPVYLQLCLDQSYHPTGWYTFPSDEFMKNEILLSKRLGLTGNRVHIKVELPRKLYWADRLGVLIQADVPCAWGDASEAMFEEHWKCFEGMLRRDFNHPSIYQWTLFNETWGLRSNRSLAMGLAAGGKGKRECKYRDWAQRRVADAYLKAKACDPTRLIEDNSPCSGDHVVTDVNTWHSYNAGYNWENTVASICTATEPGGRWNYIGGQVQGDEPMMNSECGNVWGYAGSAGDCDFSWDYHLMMNAFRRHLKCVGWLYTEHHDVCNEWNGYVRFDRSPKYDGMDELAGMTIADFHRDAALYFAGRRGGETAEALPQGARLTLPVGVSLVTGAYAGKSLSLSVRRWYHDGAGARRDGSEESVPGAFAAKDWQCETLWQVPLALPDEAAAGAYVFTLKADGREIARNFWCFATTNAASAAPVVAAGSFEHGVTNVLGGLKLNGFGAGSFAFTLEAPAAGGTFRAELSAKRWNGKDRPKDAPKDGLDYMLGGGNHDRSANPNSYPQTSDVKHPATIRIFIGDRLVKTQVLPDDPADHRGILSWLSQPHDRHLYEAGSYGYLVEAPVPASAVKDGKVAVRIESDRGLAVYGAAFGRYPFAPHVGK